MSLLEEAYKDLTVVNKSIEPDGYGGVVTTWADGASIKGAIVYDGSTEMQVAKAMGVTATYTLTVNKDVILDYHTVIRRESDKKIFRLTTNSDDMKTPESAGLNMRQYKCEEWTLNGQVASTT